MASFKNLKSGKVRVFVCVNGVRETKIFNTSKQAKSWAREREVELSKLGSLVDDKRTLKDVFERYANEVSPQKEGAHWEILRLNLFVREFPGLCQKRLLRLTKEDFQNWVLERSQAVANSSVNRELNIISNCLTVAKDEWYWMSHNPMKGLKRLKNPKPRNRRISEQEIAEICCALGYQDGVQPQLKREFVGAAFLFAIETAMRAGEICSLTPEDVDTRHKVAHLKKTKNGDERDVPLTDRAIVLLQSLPKVGDEETLFQLSSRSLSTIFRKHKLQTTIQDLTFHDTRHEATTRLAGKLHVLSLAKVTGHRDIKELMTYYNESAQDIAKKLSEETVQVGAMGLGGELGSANMAQMAQQLLQQIAKAAGQQAV